MENAQASRNVLAPHHAHGKLRALFSLKSKSQVFIIPMVKHHTAAVCARKLQVPPARDKMTHPKTRPPAPAHVPRHLLFRYPLNKAAFSAYIITPFAHQSACALCITEMFGQDWGALINNAEQSSTSARGKWDVFKNLKFIRQVALEVQPVHAAKRSYLCDYL